MNRTIIPFLAIGLAMACAAGSAQAITFGEPDAAEHPQVGTLLYRQNGVGWYSCTGTLLTPTVMLTAGHCTESRGQTNDVTYVRFAEDATEGRRDYDTLQEWLDAEWILATNVIPHPDYDDYSAFPQTYDVGLVILAEPVYVSAYGQLPTEGFLENVLEEPGNSTNWWTAVGYGYQGVINPFYMADFARYKAVAQLIEIKSKNTGPGSSAKFTNNPGRDTGGTCFGDSGGPVFYQDTPIIGAIVSWGITPCIGVDYQFRIDTRAALDFIKSYLPD